MEIRNYQSGDQQQVIALWQIAFPNAAGHNDPVASIERKVRADDSLFFVAVEGDAIIGTAMAGYDGHRGWLYSIAVAPTERRKGVGARLVRHAEAALASRGCPKVNLQILADNANVVAFYESLGFACEERVSMGKILSE